MLRLGLGRYWIELYQDCFWERMQSYYSPYRLRFTLAVQRVPKAVHNTVVVSYEVCSGQQCNNLQKKRIRIQRVA